MILGHALYANKAFHDAAEAVQDVVSNDEYLRSHGASYRLTYRIKDKYQLSLKMKNKGLDNPNDVRDALGLRIILEHPLKKDESPEEHTERGRKLTYYVISL
jgi:(p)ppGpp synthase/HD superfamily hydrolase